MKRVIFAQTVREVALQTAVFVAEAIVAVWIDRTTPYLRHVAVPDVTLTFISTAITIVLAFRVNAAYARWWEARSLWGGIVNGSRSLARQVLAVAGDSPDARAFALKIIELEIGYAHAFAAQLHGDDARQAARTAMRADVLPQMQKRFNLATGLLTEIACDVHRAQMSGVLNPVNAARMDTSLSEIGFAQGGCERIKSTPLPLQFSVLSTIFVYVYAALLPLALADSLGAVMPVVTGVITFVFLAVAEIGTNLENPFGERLYNLSVGTFVNGIESVLRSESEAIVGVDSSA